MAATTENAMLYNTAAQTVAAGTELTLPTSQINSTGDITADGTTGLTLAAGQYLVSFAADAAPADAGTTITAALALDDTALDYTAVSVPGTLGTGDRIFITAIVEPTAGQSLSVLNNGADSNTYTNAVLTVTKLA